MKHARTNVSFVIAVLLLGVLFSSCSRRVVHGRPYQWDAFVLPDLSFTNTPVAEIVSRINVEVAKASKGTVTQAVYLDAGPTDIVTRCTDDSLKPEMEGLVETFRKGETHWISIGAAGYGTFRCSETFMSGHSLGCTFRQLSDWAQLSYEEKKDGLYLKRDPAHLECRSYKVTARLVQMADDLRRRNHVRVDCDPVASAFIDVTGSYLWSFSVPTSPSGTISEYRYDSVFKYIPEKSVLLVIETPETHLSAAKVLREKGFIKD